MDSEIAPDLLRILYHKRENNSTVFAVPPYFNASWIFGVFCSVHPYLINSTTLSLGIFQRLPILTPWIILLWSRSRSVFFPTFNAILFSHMMTRVVFPCFVLLKQKPRMRIRGWFFVTLATFTPFYTIFIILFIHLFYTIFAWRYIKIHRFLYNFSLRFGDQKRLQTIAR